MSVALPGAFLFCFSQKTCVHQHCVFSLDTFADVWPCLFNTRVNCPGNRVLWFAGSQCHHLAPHADKHKQTSLEVSRAPVALKMLQSARAPRVQQSACRTKRCSIQLAPSHVHFFICFSYLSLPYWVSRWFSCQPLRLVPDVTSGQVQSAPPRLPLRCARCGMAGKVGAMWNGGKVGAKKV